MYETLLHTPQGRFIDQPRRGMQINVQSTSTMLCYVKHTAVVPELRVTLRLSPDDRTPVHHRFQYR